MNHLQNFAPEDESDFAPDYPTAFGITFTPIVSGIVFTVIGFGVAGWLWTSQVQPVQEKNTELKGQLQQKKQELTNENNLDVPKTLNSLNQQIEEQQDLRQKILALFSDRDSLDTLLLDVNRLVSQQGAELTSYRIENPEPVIVNDGSLGSLVNGKLKRQTINLEVTGSFRQTERVLQEIERLQTLLLIDNFNARQTETQTYSFNGAFFIPQNTPKLTTSMTLNVLLPLTPQEKEAREKAEEEAAKQNK